MVHEQEQNPVRRYLLQQLSEPEQQAFELRLLSEDELSEELEIVEDELIDDYIGNELSRDERVSFEGTFLTHPERQRKLEAAQALRRYLDSNPYKPVQTPGLFERLVQWVRSFFPGSHIMAFADVQGSTAVLHRSLAGAVALLVVGVAGFTIWRLVVQQSDLQQGLLALNEAYRANRPLEARVSGIDYAPFDTLRSGKPEHVNDVARKRAEYLMLEAFNKRHDGASYHALGRLFLLQKDVDKAIEYLEQARKADNNNPQIYADLGAAYLEKGKVELDSVQSETLGPSSGKSVENFGRSLEYLKHALELDPELLEAFFNRALVHRYQGLYREAEADWRSYLEKDSSSKWAEEARHNLKLLQEKTSRRSEDVDDPFDAFIQAYRARNDELAWETYKHNHQAKGNDVTKLLLDHLLADTNWKTSENLKALSYLGELERRKTNDAYTSDLAKSYASMTPQTQGLLVQARQQFEEGYRLFRKARIADGTKLLESALETFQKVGNLPESLKTEAAIAHGAVVQPDLEKGKALLARIIPDCESRNYKWFLAQSLSERSHLQSNLNEYSEAFSDGTRALQLFQELGDVGNVLDSFVQIAGVHLFLNDHEMSFFHLAKALSLAENERALDKIWRIQITISLNLYALELYRAALDYQKEALLLAETLPPLYISRSYQHIGLTYGALGQFDLALQNVRLAYEQGKPLSGESLGQNMMASASLRLGDLYRASGDLNNALASYDESSHLYEGLGFGHYSYAAHKGRFLTYLAQNDDVMAYKELQTVLTLFDVYRQKILLERQNSFFFDKAQDTYDLAIDFAYTRLKNPELAYYYSEFCRARNLNDLMRNGAEVTQTDSGLDLRLAGVDTTQSAPALHVRDIQNKLPAQVQLVQFSVLEDKVLVWYVTRLKLAPEVLDVDSTRLSELVKTTLNRINQRDQNGTAAGLKSLYKLIIAPIRDKFDPSMVLCFIPDKDLHNVPFDALISDTTGRYLAQDFRVLLSPSTTVLIESTNKAHARNLGKAETLLAVGNPSFDRVANPNLPRLPEAQREVEALAPRYSTPRILVNRQATRESIMRDLPSVDVAHFAAHYQVDPRSRLSSKLLLAPELRDHAHRQASDLTSAEIYRVQLTRIKLVVLSACTTGIERQFRGEGPIGFARAFLVAGVPVVVASLWPVDSDATAELMIAFHRFRRRDHKSTTEALMLAKQYMINHENTRYRDPYYWAGFTAVGGYSDY